jgi:hypothetical protein
MRLVPIAYSAVATIVIGGSAILLPAASAQAATQDPQLLGTLTCQGTDFTTFAPSLTSTPTSTLIFGDDTFGPCVSTDTSISGGVDYSQTSDPSASCDTLLAGGSGSTTFFWSNGHSSTFTYKQTTTDVNGEIVSTDTGTITGGEFAGNLATEVLVEPTTDLTECQSSGISTASGTVTLEILPL